jgi:hypothetical protein
MAGLYLTAVRTEFDVAGTYWREIFVCKTEYGILQFCSVEIPTRCSFVIEFIIPKFIAGLICFEQQTAHYQEL